MSARSQSSGKVVDTWYYEVEEVVGEDSANPHVRMRKVQIVLSIFKKFSGDAPPLTTKEVWFELTCGKPEFTLQGSDVEALRAAMWAELHKKFEIDWVRYYLIEVEHRAPYSGLGTGLCFGYEDVYRGVAHDGSVLMKRYQYHRGNVIEPWPGDFRHKRDGRDVACIPATPANRKSLEEFGRRIELLREKLVEAVKPEAIQQFLASLSSTKLLPAPEPKKKRR